MSGGRVVSPRARDVKSRAAEALRSARKSVFHPLLKSDCSGASKFTVTKTIIIHLVSFSSV
jgi:hypothetical protein